MATTPSNTNTSSSSSTPTETSKVPDTQIGSLDTFANTSERELYTTQTAVDGAGIERIVAPTAGSFTPAPLEATDEQKAAAKRREAMFDKASKERQASLTGEIKDEDRALNNPADGGSQSSPAI